MGKFYLNNNQRGKRFLTQLCTLAIAFTSNAFSNPFGDPFVQRPYYNDKKVPEAKDLMAIQKQLQSSMVNARAATVCIQMGKGSGSGVIISEDGFILTAAHVSTGVGKKMKVVMEDGTKYDAITLGLDSDNDAAMMKIVTPGKYPFVVFEKGDSQEKASTKLGDWVFSLGHSGGFNKDRGSVVRLGRLVRIAENTIQTDCRLIGGDSGGPLFDMNGQLIAIHSRVGAVLDMNMHVPLHVYHRSWDDMKNSKFLGGGKFAKKAKIGGAFIGIAVEKAAGGLKITDVDETAAAGQAGIKVGDILVALNGKKVTERQHMKDFMKDKSEGNEITLSILSGGKPKDVKIVLGAR